MKRFEDIEVSRRAFLAGGAALGATLALPSGVFAAISNTPVGSQSVVVHLYLRGGFDSLAAVFPMGNRDLAVARPSIGIPDSVALPLGGGWGLHPALAPFVPFWNAGELMFIVGTGTPTHSRSHFDETNALSRANYGSATLTRSGWIARATEELVQTGPIHSVSIASSTFSSRNGTRPNLSVGRLANTRFPSVSGLSTATFQDFVRQVGRQANTTWATRATTTVDAVRAIEGTRSTPTTVVYPATETGARLRDAAALIKSNLGVRFIDLDFSGDFDLHARVGTFSEGSMRDLLTDLSTSLSAFRFDLGDLWSNVVVVTMTEFGRRVQENASQGVDHGWASAMLAMGGRINGGRIIGQLPDLHPTQLDNGDVRVSIDYRTVLSEVLARGSGFSADSLSRVFPRFTGVPLGVIR